MTDSVSPVSTVVLPATVRVPGPPSRGGDARSELPRSGKSAPDGGDALPLSGPMSSRSAGAAVEHLNELLRAAERRVRFAIDESSGKTLIFVVDANTGEIVRQIPPKQLVTLAQRFGMPGAILDAHA